MVSSSLILTGEVLLKFKFRKWNTFKKFQLPKVSKKVKIHLVFTFGSQYVAKKCRRMIQDLCFISGFLARFCQKFPRDDCHIFNGSL
jgi:hypothetical protein